MSEETESIVDLDSRSVEIIDHHEATFEDCWFAVSDVSDADLAAVKS